MAQNANRGPGAGAYWLNPVASCTRSTTDALPSHKPGIFSLVCNQEWPFF